MMRLAVAFVVVLAVTSGCGAQRDVAESRGVQSTPPAPTCDLPGTGPVSVEQLPEGSSVVECDAVGRVVVWRGAGVTVPSPGNGVDIFTERANRHVLPRSFGIFVAENGVMSYEFYGAH
jgi:hypothetical protein